MRNRLKIEPLAFLPAMLLAVALVALPGAARGDKVVIVEDDEPDVDVTVVEEDETVGHVVGMWPVNRLLDLLDIGRANLTLGPGLGVEVHATDVFHLKMGGYSGARIGWRGRGLPFYAESGKSDAPEVMKKDYARPKTVWYIGLWGHLLLVGAEAGVDPLELVDFVTGVFFIDLLDDDL